ncbi:alkaline phosphatase family protein [Pontibacter qinzhouensis]|uniref:Alkaline phosphatase family protein n=1 Tax=Pontibacter qinzhouensis TaxID=2603253 RepID=A0A5C8K7I7_9BACT|nr:alkaline phosphatase PafA [Pontibacter qinzhouensis]TXK45714.1 alkaline phosphatase family protein [Pontibacter qinzhouensis]
MKKFLLFCFSTFLLNSPLLAQPKLVVGIVVDQMRYDYLSKYQGQLSEGGFRRFLIDGYVMANHYYNYVPTFTGPGHAAIYTGTTPAVNGIIGNEWYDKTTGQSVYCVEDSSVQPVGTEKPSARRSPVLMQSTSILDQWRFHTSMKAKTIGVAIKDRSAILPAGHRASGAFWMDATSGGFVTSSYYMAQLPDWVKRFNERNLAEKYLSQKWDLLLSEKHYAETDDAAFEKNYKGLDKPVLPYDLPQIRKNSGLGILSSTPFGNTITVDFAIAAIEGEQLGQDSITDILALSFSSPDIIGHQFGPHSREVHDTYLRLDQEMQRFLKYLDKKFGMDNVLIFLTADHGAADVPAYVKSNTGYYSGKKIQDVLNGALKQGLGVDGLVRNVSNEQVFLDWSLISKHKIDLQQVLLLSKQSLSARQGVYDIMLASDLGQCRWVSSLCDLVRNGYNPQRSGDMLLVMQPGWISDYYSSAGGTTHGSPFSYDTHIPMMWLGWKVPNGITYERTVIPDIAPTLSLLLGNSMPNGTTGTPMVPLLESISTQRRVSQIITE